MNKYSYFCKDKFQRIKMTMKKIAYFLMTLVAAVTVFSSCSDDETYADQKKRERNAINRYISEKASRC